MICFLTSPLQLILMSPQVCKPLPLGFLRKPSEGVHECPETVCKFVYMGVLRASLGESGTVVSLGSPNTDPHRGDTTVKISGSRLCASSQHSGRVSQHFHLPSTVRTWGRFIYLPVSVSEHSLVVTTMSLVVSFLPPEAQCEQMCHYRNVWLVSVNVC